MSRMFLGLAAIAAITLAPIAEASKVCYQPGASFTKYYDYDTGRYTAKNDCYAYAQALGYSEAEQLSKCHTSTSQWTSGSSGSPSNLCKSTSFRYESFEPVVAEGDDLCVGIYPYHDGSDGSGHGIVKKIANFRVCGSGGGDTGCDNDWVSAAGECLAEPEPPQAAACEDPSHVEYVSTGTCFPEEVDGPSALVICVKENDAPIQDHHLSVGDAGRVTSGSVQARVYVPGNVGASIEMTPEADSIAGRPDCFSIPGIPGLTIADGTVSVGWTAVIRNFLITDGLGPQSIELSVNSLEYEHLGIQFGFQGSDGEYFHYGEIPLIEGDTVSFPEGPEASVIKFHDVLRDDAGSPVGTIKNYQIRIQPIIP